MSNQQNDKLNETLKEQTDFFYEWTEQDQREWIQKSKELGCWDLIKAEEDTRREILIENKQEVLDKLTELKDRCNRTIDLIKARKALEDADIEKETEELEQQHNKITEEIPL